MLLFAVVCAPLRAGAEGVLVFAAASLKTALDQVAADYQRQTGQGVTVSYAASSVLARQIQAGAPADIFISANEDWMDVLQDQDQIDEASRVDLLGNGLVVIAGRDQPDIALESGDALTSALGRDYLAMALVDAVPAGIYGKAALETLGLWQMVEGQVAQTDNVRAALALVAVGAARLGIVYRTDAQAEPRVRVVAEVDSSLHPVIIYPAAMTAKARPGAGAFLDYLTSDAAQAVFKGQGFTLPGT